ncbi:hypothetical protein J6590_039147 [Homalodisca vitripennis]|nr:hypothetical protein J6590_039147 [Homalodisca vitripennis]
MDILFGTVADEAGRGGHLCLDYIKPTQQALQATYGGHTTLSSVDYTMWRRVRQVHFVTQFTLFVTQFVAVCRSHPPPPSPQTVNSVSLLTP